jgi:hypothetical protein
MCKPERGDTASRATSQPSSGQCGAFEQLEQTHRLAGGASERRIGRAVAGEQAAAGRLFQRQRRGGITEVELLNVAAAAQLAALGGIEQFCGKTEHISRNRPAFFLVAVEQRIAGPADDRLELPSEIIGILHAGIEALAARRRVRVRGVPDQEHATEAITIGQPRIHGVGGRPMHRLDANVVAPSTIGHHRREPCGGKVDVALERNRGLQLEQLGSGERAQRHLPVHRAIVETVPCLASETRQDDIGHDGTDAKRLAREFDAERVAHEAAPAVGADEIAHAMVSWVASRPALRASRAVTPSSSCSSPTSSHPNSR